jgi:hypothetical protein
MRVRQATSRNLADDFAAVLRTGAAGIVETRRKRAGKTSKHLEHRITAGNCAR